MPNRAHMPRLYHRIHDHVKRKGVSDSVAWAIAVKAVAKGCLEGEADFPGRNQFGAVARARYCAAYTQWKKSHSGSGYGKVKEGRG